MPTGDKLILSNVFSQVLSFIYYFYFNASTKTPEKDQLLYLCTMVKIIN